MSVRVLTDAELLSLPVGSEVVVCEARGMYKDGEDEQLNAGRPLFKGNTDWDELGSVRFDYGDGDFDYFEEGQIGIVEVTKHPLIVRPSKEQTERPAEELGVYRPELGTRKVGKVRVELVDEGFPLALREVAQVMTWAQTAKGYKDHDWQNLPDAEVALAAAASRHRTDHIKQRVVGGLDIVDCVDVESGLLHKAHEAFGVLAQLELMLRGKFVDSRPQIGL